MSAKYHDAQNEYLGLKKSMTACIDETYCQDFWVYYKDVNTYIHMEAFCNENRDWAAYYSENY